MSTLSDAQHAVLRDAATDTVALLEYAGLDPTQARYALILEVALETSAGYGAPYAVACLKKALREMQKVAKELEP